MKKILTTMALVAASVVMVAKSNALTFQAKGESMELTMPDGQVVKFTAYTGIRYVTNVEDTTYQTLNFFVPEGANQQSAILMRTYVGGYMAARAAMPSVVDATGRALQEGMCVCIPGSRGANSEQGGTSTGKAPRGLLDLKAAVRYLRYNDKRMMGSAERIITDGTSAGGAMSALLGTTANHPDYEKMLQAMGAAKAKDHVFASVCYCPITDLDHADMAYEWLYGSLRDASDQASSKALAAAFVPYLQSLNLRHPATGESLQDEDQYRTYLESYILASVSRFAQEGGVVPDSLGFEFFKVFPRTPGQRPGGPRHVRAKAIDTDLAIGMDLPRYLAYVAERTPLKSVPAFDNLSSPECSVFGDAQGRPAHFTGSGLSAELIQRVRMMNPMNYIDNPKATKAQYWYIRHGAIDRDTSFPVAVNLATKLMNGGKQVDFALPWNRPHTGDYNLDDLFRWMKDVLREAGK